MILKYREVSPLSYCALPSNTQTPIAVYHGEVISSARFNSEVNQLAASFSKLKNDKFALYYEQTYSFCVSLFALLHSNKKIWIAANNKSSMATQLTERGCMLLGDWGGDEASITVNAPCNFQLMPLDPNEPCITIFTSGSSGQAKEIHKTLQQFQTEIETLEHCWGADLGDAQILATVSHQHIYGLLFRLLWPLAAGRCFHSDMYLSPEPLLKVAEGISACWVASPAQLKRLDEMTPWLQLSKLKALFSSGGALPLASVTQIFQQSRQKVLEVYGSSETGGIAWRQSVDDALWTAFDGINISVDEKGQNYLSSPYLAEKKQGDNLPLYKMDDKIKLLANNQFELLGRLDRIVKIEEKRLSLDELESALNKIEWIQLSYTLLLADKRDKIASVIVLTQSGQDYLQQYGRASLIKQLRKRLMDSFETVVLPKKWLFINALPMTAQGKINRELLVQLFSLDPIRSPQIQYCSFQEQTVELQCRIAPNLIYFSGHFLEQPILPGVTQLAWAERFAKIFFPINAPFLRMEVVKFKKIIQPEAIIKINLSWKADSGKLYFEITSAAHAHSSGRIVYGENE
jgi:acyl-coenzyme A synthetase/AMP-(fatty) acid ligase/3-hydroxymyristoyl/3-hydroxydecanoyl-(acyl carrier protein) dehydratase